MKTIRTEEMNWQDIQETIQKGFKTLVVAVGSIEQHGPHLPTNTDTLIGDSLVNEVVKKIGNALQGPTIRIGCSKHHLDFPGTITLGKDTFKAVICDYTESVAEHGFDNIVFIPSHGGNFEPLEEAISDLRKKITRVKIFGYTDLYGFLDLLTSFSIDAGKTQEEAGAHAGENETSLILALAEELVVKDRLLPGFTEKFTEKEGQIIFEKGMKTLTENGVIGDPRRASRRDGVIYFEKLADFMANEVLRMIS
ncbi:MAG: creatininase family protein [Candidatus Heimdallarchaeota archaeon]|nr:creatininase family protein [Candidatus Heimdallarchaeota archaeon]MBY8995674.1 creatininase family protein [Candidatus Heimdallarchaeota archaeon]